MQSNTEIYECGVIKMDTMDKNTRGVLLVLSGPSGTGKGTVCKVVRDSLGDNLAYSIYATTRKPRTGEEHGREYFFFTKEEFESLRDQNGFLEWAQVYDNYYGTPRAFVEEVLALVPRVESVRFVVMAGFVPSCLPAENAITVTISVSARRIATAMAMPRLSCSWFF